MKGSHTDTFSGEGLIYLKLNIIKMFIPKCLKFPFYLPQGIHHFIQKTCNNSLFSLYGWSRREVPGMIILFLYWKDIKGAIINSFYLKALFVLGISSFNYLAQKFFEPYEDDVLNEMEERSLVSSTFTLYCALLYLEGNWRRKDKNLN